MARSDVLKYSPYYEFINRNLYPGVLGSDECILTVWDDHSGREYIKLVYKQVDENRAAEYTVYEYDLQRFKLIAKLFDDANKVVRIVEKTEKFIRRVNTSLEGLPAPLAMAKLLNITGLLALRLEACSPGALDETIRLLEEAERDG